MKPTDRPGREIPKEYREVVEFLVDVEGWRYDASGKGHPVLYPSDRTKPALRVPTTPGRNPRGWQNWLAEVRRRGGRWPPGGRK